METVALDTSALAAAHRFFIMGAIYPRRYCRQTCHDRTDFLICLELGDYF